jgi:hypothetical protein
MEKRHFDQLVKGVREMKRHMAGKPVRGARITELPSPTSEQFVRRAWQETLMKSPRAYRRFVARRSNGVPAS